MDRKNRALRLFELQTRATTVDETGAEELWVEGYAARFNSPTVLFEMAGQEYSEQIAAGAFDGCPMDDVIMNYNHGGKVVARTRNGTLLLEVDDTGLRIRARLDGTEEGRRLYEEIKGGYIDRMSFAFQIAEESFDEDKRLWTVRRIKRLFDVSAVDIPAYDDTSIEARRAAVQTGEKSLAARRLTLKIKLTN